MYKLTIIFTDGSKEIGFYETEDQAKEFENGFYMVFGGQISYTYIERSRA